ncbi:hypothetical protein AAGS61_10480 [Lysinibacillus sp. KU-BSD001]|uniref:hypothetical protein n=1 Tax=Lysinibacillus sp. KU-BSD001 TaxID=3141328 RepID=UPI0036E4DFE1
MMNRIGDIQPLIQDYRSKISDNESELAIKILDDYEELLQLFKQKNEMINQIWDFHENEKYQLAHETLDPLEQILYSSLLGIRTLDEEAQSDSAKDYLASLKKEIERQLHQLKEASISVYPICMQDLGPYGAIKSYYELLKEGKNITIDIDFKGTLKRQPLKIENNIFRFIQHLIQIIDNLNTVDSLSVTMNEKDGRIVITFEGKALAERLNHSSKYQLFKELVDSIEDVEIVEKNECTFNLVLQTNN